MKEVIFQNAQVVLRNEVLHGDVSVRGNLIADVQPGGPAIHGAIDVDGDFLMPGLVELHTDQLEHHLRPRPGVAWPSLPALAAHDAQLAAMGITTVLDAVSLGVGDSDVRRPALLHDLLRDIELAAASGALRADHHLHLRLEITHPEIIALALPFLDDSSLRMVSLMDHTPGTRQYADVEIFRKHHRRQFGQSEEDVEARIRARREHQEQYAESNRAALVKILRGAQLRIASHDDTTVEHVEQAAAEGVQISEFPTTRVAAEAARRLGLKIVMGAPNAILGGSHSGNVAAAELARLGLLDSLSSDYVPSSLLQAIFLLSDQEEIPFCQAVAMASANSAEIAGLTDRGSIDVGKRADLIRVRHTDGVPIVREAWRAGARVA